MAGAHANRQNGAEVESISSTDAKNVFGSLLDKAIAGKTVVITRHEVPKAVLLGIEEFAALTRGGAPSLEGLSRAFDDRLAAMQSGPARAAVKTAFAASPKQLARAAVKAARPRG